MTTATTTSYPDTRLLINNEWRPSSSGKTMEVVNPATEEVVAAVAAAEGADVDVAVEAARAALNGPWGKMSARERGRLVNLGGSAGAGRCKPKGDSDRPERGGAARRCAPVAAVTRMLTGPVLVSAPLTFTRAGPMVKVPASVGSSSYVQV